MTNSSNINVFVMIARKGSISGAARELNMSAATASAHLDALEGHLGGKLFIRSTRQLVLTDLGRMYLERVTPVLDKLELANQIASEFNTTPQGLLRVTAGGLLGREKIARMVARFIAQFPEIDVFLNIDDSLRPALDEHYHVAIRTGSNRPSNLIQRKIASNRRVLVASPIYLAGAPPIDTLDDLKSHKLLLLTHRQDKRGTMRFSVDGVTRQIEFEGKMTSGSDEALTVWLKNHLGIAQKSLWEVADDMAAGGLVPLLEQHEPEPLDFYALSPFRSGESVKVDSFISFLRAEFAKSPLC